jgi:hypothetical protein
MIILRPKYIKIGKDASNSGYWTSIRSVKYKEVSPWVHIEIPAGTMVHQHIKSPHVTGEIRCKDYSQLYHALFEIYVDASNHTAIDTSVFYTKWQVDYLRIVVEVENKTELTFQVDGFKVTSLYPVNIELGLETEWVVEFSADRIIKEA